jgi:hypothetical protein
MEKYSSALIPALEAQDTNQHTAGTRKKTKL